MSNQSQYLTKQEIKKLLDLTDEKWRKMNDTEKAYYKLLLAKKIKTTRQDRALRLLERQYSRCKEKIIAIIQGINDEIKQNLSLHTDETLTVDEMLFIKGLEPTRINWTLIPEKDRRK